MRVLILGGQGYLGERFQSVYLKAIVPRVDIADAQAIANVLDREKPDIVINAAGKTGRPNIDWCEEHKIETLRSNVTGPLVLLEECSKRNIYWVHLSSGCIYEGSKYSLSHGERVRERGSKQRGSDCGFTEDDPPNFFGSFYSRTKLWSEQILKDFPNILILRLRMPFDCVPSERNLIMKLRTYNKVLDVQNSLTYIPDLLLAAEKLILKHATGIYNVVNPGTMSPYDIMSMYKKLVQFNHLFKGLKIKELSKVARTGRSNCVLSNKKLEQEEIVLPDVHKRMEEAMMMLKKSLCTKTPTVSS